MSDIEKGSVEVIESTSAAKRSYVPRPSTIGNPAPLGMFSFASSTFMLSMYNAQVRGITQPNVVVGMAIWCGGIVQILAGMWEFPRNNVFGVTALTSYGAFWLSYATILIPSSGILSAYGDDTAQLQSALGIFLTTWCMFTFALCFVSIGKNITFIVLFGVLGTTLATLASGQFFDSVAATRAGGVMGVVVAFMAYYVGLSQLLESESHPVIRLPLGLLHTSPKKD
ncbi:hypothetical protein DXG03_008370 [Asterophora parasitica]|uniref:Gpr1 family protein n=1 Tax=Asterophora parasitica TaxID=117018 RepID=A0A9P7G5X7_9AGAR|nr:hypothetical protein DXG03_008370 [Asterophora parasitica]